jgi:hypothetical protein
MKKLIAIAMVFALVAGAAFAADLSASVGISANLAEGSSKEAKEFAPNDVSAGLKWLDINLSASAQNDEGTFGGWIKITPQDSWKALMGQAWWKPIEQFKFMLNYSDTGFFGADDITCWGFYEGAGDPVANHGNAWGGGPEGAASGAVFRDAAYGGFERGGIFTITPMSGLEINVGVPFLEGTTRGESIYKGTEAQVAYNIEGMGKVAFTFGKYKNDSGNGGGGDNVFYNSGGIDIYEPGKLFGYFSLSAVENLGLVIGFGVPFYQVSDPKFKPFKMAASLGAKYSLGAFGVKARFLADMGGWTYDDVKFTQGVRYIFDLMPYYAISDSMSVNLSVGFGGKGADSDKDGVIDNTAIEPGWHVYPYVTLKGGPGTFYVGVQIWSRNIGYANYDSGSPVFEDKDGDNAIIHWSIPVGLTFSF